LAGLLCGSPRLFPGYLKDPSFPGAVFAALKKDPKISY